MRILTAAAAAALVLFGLAVAAGAEEAAEVGDILIQDAYARASVGQAGTSVVYMTLVNTGDEADRLVGAASPAAEAVEPHTHLMEDGIMRMRPAEAIEVAPGTPTVLRPGGLHLMVIGLRAPLREGESMPLTLSFERSGEVELELPIRSIAATMGGMGQGGGHSQGHGGGAN